jgi:hypothetical protein
MDVSRKQKGLEELQSNEKTHKGANENEIHLADVGHESRG